MDLIVCNGFKSDIIFHTLKNRMHEEADIVRKLSGIMQFDITKNDKKSVWSEFYTLFIHKKYILFFSSKSY